VKLRVFTSKIRLKMAKIKPENPGSWPRKKPGFPGLKKSGLPGYPGLPTLVLTIDINRTVNVVVTPAVVVRTHYCYLLVSLANSSEQLL